MPHTFDTGHTSPQRKLIVQKMIDALTPLKLQSLGGSAIGFLEAVIPISYRVDRSDEDFAIGQLMLDLGGKSPAVAIAPLDLRAKQAGGPGRAVGELEIEVYIVSSHMRELTEGRASTDAIATADITGDPGIWAILELVWMYLFDIKMGTATVHELKLEREAEIVTDEKVTIWKQEWAIQVGRDVNLYRGLAQMFTNAKTTLNPTDDQPDTQNIKVDTTVG